MKNTIYIMLLLALPITAFANVQLFGDFKSGFISGQFTCEEVNQYGTLTYACGGPGSTGSIQGIPSDQPYTLPTTFFNSYHNPKLLKIYSVSIVSFNGEIFTNQEKEFHCQFAGNKITKNQTYRLLLTKSGQCIVLGDHA